MEKYLQDLVAMRTVSSDKDANNIGLDYLETFCRDKGLFVVRYTYSGHGALVATTRKDAKDPKVMLAAHLDIVPAPEHLFELRSDETKFYGRGVYDMKFAIASYMAAIDKLGEASAAHDVGIMITTEEEIGGLNGVRQLVEKEDYHPQVVILPDGATDWKIETFAKGFFYGIIDVAGISSHGSMPWEGDSASFKLIDLLHELKAYFADQSLNTNTINIGTLDAGLVKNQLPARASAGIDIRYLSKVEHDKIVQYITALCAKYDATFTELDLGGHPCVNELSNPFISAFADSIKTVTGHTSTGTVSYGASDARFFAGVDVPAVICRPPGGGQHADSEWIDKQGALQYADVILDYIKKIAPL